MKIARISGSIKEYMMFVFSQDKHARQDNALFCSSNSGLSTLILKTFWNFMFCLQMKSTKTMTFDTRQGRAMSCHDIYACHSPVTVSHTICLHFNQQIFYALISCFSQSIFTIEYSYSQKWRCVLCDKLSGYSYCRAITVKMEISQDVNEADPLTVEYTCRGCMAIETEAVLHPLSNKRVRELFVACTGVQV